MLPLHRWPRAGLTLFRTFGVHGIALRSVHELRRAADRFRDRPLHPGHDLAPPSPHPFRVDADRLRGTTDPAEAIRRGERVIGGEHQAFRWGWRPLPSSPEEWVRHPATGVAFPSDAPWWKVPHIDRARGDIKDVWEPGRFAWVYDLVRAYLVTGEARYREHLVRRLGEWYESSPPFRGPHWSCGQETAIRAVALLYAEANVLSGEQRDPRVEAVLAASGERIADAFGYAVSQRNNHAISEAVGLLLLGDRFRGQHPEAARWLRQGRRALERLIREQFAPDGWFIQHSFTYLRLALDQCVLAQRVLASRGDTLPEGALARLRAALNLVLAVMDPSTGRPPNHGHSDGAFVHPITLGGYRDFRPMVSAAAAVLRVPLPPQVRVDQESLAWLGVDAPAVGDAPVEGIWTGESGWAVARVGATSVFLRAGRYRSRPGHLDPLHLDVRLDGRELIVDPGTYAYNAPPPWNNGLASAWVHNGPVLDGREPGTRGPRFLWYAWPEAVLTGAEWGGHTAILTAEIPGRVRREVRVSRHRVRVQDVVLDPRACSVAMRWLLHPDASPEQVSVEGGFELREAAEGSVAGWYSQHYGERQASRYLEVVRDARRGPVTTTLERGVQETAGRGVAGSEPISRDREPLDR